MAISYELRGRRQLRPIGHDRMMGQRVWRIEGEDSDPVPLVGLAIENANPPLPFVGDFFPKDNNEEPLPQAQIKMCQLREFVINQHPQRSADAIVTALYDSGPDISDRGRGPFVNVPGQLVIWSEYTIEATEQTDFALDGTRIPGGASRFVPMIGIRGELEGGIVTEAMLTEVFTVNSQTFLGYEEDTVFYKGVDPELISGSATSWVLDTTPTGPRSKLVVNFVQSSQGWAERRPQLQGPTDAEPGEPLLGPDGFPVFDFYPKYRATFFDDLFTDSGFLI